MRGCGNLATNVAGKAERVRSLTVSPLRLTCKVQWCGALRWSDEWNPLRMTEFRRLSTIRSQPYGRPRVERHIPNLVRP
jgi:hypothetical protein